MLKQALNLIRSGGIFPWTVTLLFYGFVFAVIANAELPALPDQAFAIHTARAFVMQPRDVHRHALQQQRRAFAHRFIAAGSELIEKLLMTVHRLVRPCRAKLVIERGRVTQAH